MANDGYAVVWDAHRRDKYEGSVFKRYNNGIVIDLANGVRYFATKDRIITDSGANEDTGGTVDEPSL